MMFPRLFRTRTSSAATPFRYARACTAARKWYERDQYKFGTRLVSGNPAGTADRTIHRPRLHGCTEMVG